MRLPARLATVAALCVAVAALAGPSRAGLPAGVQACDVRLNVHDPDPKGVNVRSTPVGKVVAVLEPDGEWTEVHATGQSGEWLRIDRAETVDDAAPEGMREVFRGSGWVHVSRLGISELYTGDGTELRAAPDDNARLLRAITPDNEPKRTRVLGCSGEFLKVDADGLVGWTRRYCTNERTTCS